eukprot:2718169-Amphidinium_carterae.1
MAWQKPLPVWTKGCDCRLCDVSRLMSRYFNSRKVPSSTTADAGTEHFQLLYESVLARLTSVARPIRNPMLWTGGI